MKPDFQISFTKAIQSEGFISNNPADKGGFTYKGISMVKHPFWSGWKIIDSILSSHSTQQSGTELVEVLNNTELQNEVQNFYRSVFWNKIQGDLLQQQIIADEVFECSINLGVKVASENLQRTLNLLNRNSKLYPDIFVDGIIGSQTLETLKKSISVNGEQLVFNMLNYYQAKRYIEIMECDYTQKIFIGWFNRIEIIK